MVTPKIDGFANQGTLSFIASPFYNPSNYHIKIDAEELSKQSTVNEKIDWLYAHRVEKGIFHSLGKPIRCGLRFTHLILEDHLHAPCGVVFYLLKAGWNWKDKAVRKGYLDAVLQDLGRCGLVACLTGCAVSFAIGSPLGFILSSYSHTMFSSYAVGTKSVMAINFRWAFDKHWIMPFLWGRDEYVNAICKSELGLTFDELATVCNDHSFGFQFLQENREAHLIEQTNILFKTVKKHTPNHQLIDLPRDLDRNSIIDWVKQHRPYIPNEQQWSEVWNAAEKFHEAYWQWEMLFKQDQGIKALTPLLEKQSKEITSQNTTPLTLDPGTSFSVPSFSGTLFKKMVQSEWFCPPYAGGTQTVQDLGSLQETFKNVQVFQAQLQPQLTLKIIRFSARVLALVGIYFSSIPGILYHTLMTVKCLAQKIFQGKKASYSTLESLQKHKLALGSDLFVGSMLASSLFCIYQLPSISLGATLCLFATSPDLLASSPLFDLFNRQEGRALSKALNLQWLGFSPPNGGLFKYHTYTDSATNSEGKDLFYYDRYRIVNAYLLNTVHDFTSNLKDGDESKKAWHDASKSKTEWLIDWNLLIAKFRQKKSLDFKDPAKSAKDLQTLDELITLRCRIIQYLEHSYRPIYHLPFKKKTVDWAFLGKNSFPPDELNELIQKPF